MFGLIIQFGKEIKLNYYTQVNGNNVCYFKVK